MKKKIHYQDEGNVMKYENLFTNMTSIEKERIDKDIENHLKNYLKHKTLPMFSDLGRFQRVYIAYGETVKQDGQKLFEKDLCEYISTNLHLSEILNN